MMNERYIPQMQVRSNLRSGASGGYVNGVWYPDQSGVCGTSTTTPPNDASPTTPPTDDRRRICRRCLVS